jgi:murein DD-endopeptidase MepM/ murein hydrolase activator NlpD
MQDVPLFVRFLRDYIVSRVLHFAKNFENVKDIIVAFLIVKRGKYSNSFLNSSLFLLVIAAVIGAPIIAENNPFVLQANDTDTPFQTSVISYSPDQYALGTVISSKPRDKVVDYKVVGGDTLESISKKFGVSTDTIRWENNDIKDDTIKPGETLKIPPVTGVVHKVSSGETVYSIAKKYKVDAQKIVNFPFNEFADLDSFSLTPGQLVYVPDGIIEQAAPSTNGTLFEQRATSAQIASGAHGNGQFLWPTNGIITQYPVWYHMAFDIANPSQPPVLAADSGTAEYVGCINWGYGCHIIINHGNGYKTLYGHLSSFSISAGQSVSKGQQIGNMGTTGHSTGTHLHFEIRQGNTLLNPASFFNL